jgi:hypothetical protein
VSLMFSFQNGDGGVGDSGGGHVNKPFQREPVKDHPEVNMAGSTTNDAATTTATIGGGSGGGGGGKCMVKGVAMQHCRRTHVVFDPKNEDTLLRHRRGHGLGLCQGVSSTCIAGEDDDNFKPLPPPPPPSSPSANGGGGAAEEGGDRRRSSTMDRGSESAPGYAAKMGDVLADNTTIGIAALDIPGM